MIPLMKRIIDWWKIESEYVCHVILISRLIINKCHFQTTSLLKFPGRLFLLARSMIIQHWLRKKKIELEYACHAISISRLIIIWRWSEPRNHHWAMILVFDMFSTKWWFLGFDHRQIIIRRDIDIAWQANSNSIFFWATAELSLIGHKKQTPGKI